MIWIGETGGMQLLQVGREVLYPLRIEELLSVEMSGIFRTPYLSDDIGWLQESKSLHKLTHSSIIVSFGVKIVSISPMYFLDTRFAYTLRSCQTDGKRKQIPFVQHVEFGCG